MTRDLELQGHATANMTFAMYGFWNHMCYGICMLLFIFCFIVTILEIIIIIISVFQTIQHVIYTILVFDISTNLSDQIKKEEPGLWGTK